MSQALALTLLAGPLGDHPRVDRVRERYGPYDDAAKAADAALVERIQHSDARAFETLTAQYFEYVVRFTTGLLRDRESAEDVAQEIFVRLWDQRATWHPHTSVRAYLLGAARHRALDVLKHRDVHARYAASVAASADAGTTPGVDLESDLIEEMVALQRAIDALPERRRLAISLRYEQQLSHAEVGDAMGISAKAAKELIIRTLDALRAHVRGTGHRPSRL